MRKQFTFVALTLVMLTTAPWACADTYAFTIMPTDGSLVGLPGSTVGWGYTIDNLSPTEWLVTTGLNSDPFLDGTAVSLFDFPDLAPGTSVTAAFDANSGIGLYELIWDPTAASGAVDNGSFTLSAEWWSGDPLNDGSFLSAAADSPAPFSATISPVSPAPEPSCFLLIGTALFIPGCCSRMRSLTRTNSRRQP